MLRLNELVNQLVRVIVRYNETQTGKTYVFDMFLQKTHQELTESLQNLIVEATSNWRTRRSLLDYYLFIIDQVKPLVDQKKPLSDQEESLVLSHLVAVITNTKRLLETSQATSIAINYCNNPNEKMPGFIRGFTGRYTLCNTGQVIMDELFMPFHLNHVNIEECIRKIIHEHQSSLQLPLLTSQLNNLKKELGYEQEKSNHNQEVADQLLTNLDCRKQELLLLKKQLDLLFEEKNRLQQELTSQTTAFNEEKKCTSALRKENLFLINKLANLEKEQLIGEEKYTLLDNQMTSRLVEITSLKSTLTTSQDKTTFALQLATSLQEQLEQTKKNNQITLATLQSSLKQEQERTGVLQNNLDNMSVKLANLEMALAREHEKSNELATKLKIAQGENLNAPFTNKPRFNHSFLFAQPRFFSTPGFASNTQSTLPSAHLSYLSSENEVE